MSQANLALLERFVAAINTREISSETAEELVAPDLLIECVSIAVIDNTYHGVVGLRTWISDTFAGLDENARYEVEAIIAEGDDFVVARVHFMGHGTRSGLPVTLRLIHVLWFHDGRVTRETGYLHRRDALEAVGLEGQGTWRARTMWTCSYCGKPIRVYDPVAALEPTGCRRTSRAADPDLDYIAAARFHWSCHAASRATLFETYRRIEARRW